MQTDPRNPARLAAWRERAFAATGRTPDGSVNIWKFLTRKEGHSMNLQRRYQMILRDTVDQLLENGWQIDQREPRLILQRAHIRCELRSIGDHTVLTKEPIQ